jgi:tRNA A-37 threonylcarbamoyl transferase component Bud32
MADYHTAYIVKNETLIQVLRKMLGTDVTGAEYETKRLHGGTLGDVRLISGTAEAIDGEKTAYKVVLKIQKKWERYGDSGSWRREYDFYTSGFGALFTDSLRWPQCYHAEMNQEENEWQIWMEYIDGISGLDLTGDMYERAAEEMGRFQGKLYAEQSIALKNLTNLSDKSFMKNFYLHYRSWNVVYDYVRSGDSELPGHICEMLIEIDEKSDEIFSRVEKLPVVLCHRDFWVTNIFYKNDKIVLIDWDTTGWGYFGEDLASLIADEADVEHMVEYYQRCVPAYYKGFAEYADTSRITDNCVYELILLLFGYRLVEWFISAESPEKKALQANTLQRIYEIRGKKI